MVDGFLYLMQEGILKREVFDHTRLQTLINRGDYPDAVARHAGCAGPGRYRLAIAGAGCQLADSVRHSAELVEFRGGRLRLVKITL